MTTPCVVVPGVASSSEATTGSSDLISCFLCVTTARPLTRSTDTTLNLALRPSFTLALVTLPGMSEMWFGGHRALTPGASFTTAP